AVLEELRRIEQGCGHVELAAVLDLLQKRGRGCPRSRLIGAAVRAASGERGTGQRQRGAAEDRSPRQGRALRLMVGRRLDLRFQLFRHLFSTSENSGSG